MKLAPLNRRLIHSSQKEQSRNPVESFAALNESSTRCKTFMLNDSRCAIKAPVCVPTGKIPTHKYVETLRHILAKPAHRFDAERWHDHCLHTTVSTLQNGYGIPIDRKLIKVKDFTGGFTEVMLYWVADPNKAKAQALIELKSAPKVRKAPPIDPQPRCS